MNKKSISTSIESVQQEDGMWKTTGNVKMYVEEDGVGKESKFEVMSFDSQYNESVTTVSFAIYKFMSEDVDKEESWVVVKEKANE